MAPVLPNGLWPGTILHHPHFYVDAAGELKPKYLVVLAPTRSGDVIWRLLTSQHADMRPERPPCYHGDPYPGFYLGVIDTSSGLGKKSWLDLRALNDADAPELKRMLNAGVITEVNALQYDLLRAALECAAAADDTTIAQEQAIRDQMATL